ncbi:hypothetical protein BKA93DRAFT_306768 [Sparassis latifolia]
MNMDARPLCHGGHSAVLLEPLFPRTGHAGVLSASWEKRCTFACTRGRLESTCVYVLGVNFIGRSVLQRYVRSERDIAWFLVLFGRYARATTTSLPPRTGTPPRGGHPTACPQHSLGHGPLHGAPASTARGHGRVDQNDPPVAQPGASLAPAKHGVIRRLLNRKAWWARRCALRRGAARPQRGVRIVGVVREARAYHFPCTRLHPVGQEAGTQATHCAGRSMALDLSAPLRYQPLRVNEEHPVFNAFVYEPQFDPFTLPVLRHQQHNVRIYAAVSLSRGTCGGRLNLSFEGREDVEDESGRA